MAHASQEMGLIQPITRKFWFPGYTFNATGAARAALTVDTDKIKNGYVFCLDPEALTDVATLPTTMVINGGIVGGTALTAIPGGNSVPGRYMVNVCKPTTGVLQNFAGIATNLPPEGINTTQANNKGYLDQGGIWIDLIVAGPCFAWCHANVTDYNVNTLGPANADWGLVIPTLSIASGAANILALRQSVAIPVRNADTSSTAALEPVNLISQVGRHNIW